MKEFFYSDSESDSISDVKKGHLIKRLEGYRPQGCWLATITPPAQLSIGGRYIAADEIVIAEKYLGRNIEDLDAGTLTVYVFAIVNKNVVASGKISKADIQFCRLADIATSPELLPLGSHHRSLL